MLDKEEEMFFNGIKGRFRLVNGYAYAVGDNGKIVGLRSGKEKKPTINKQSKMRQVLLVANSRMKMCYVHRLVAEAWVPNPEGYPYIIHIDGDKANNNASNLRWVSVAEWKSMMSERMKGNSLAKKS